MMYPSMASPIVIFLFIGTAFTYNENTPRQGLFKRDTQLSCSALGGFGIGREALCAADDGTSICFDDLDTCCQLPDGKTPYTCAGLGNSHCCGTDKPACGSDPTCLNIKGERDVVDAQEAVTPSLVEMAAAPSKATTEISFFDATAEAEPQPLRTVTAEKNPNATGGASVFKMKWKQEGALALLGVVLAFVYEYSG